MLTVSTKADGGQDKARKGMGADLPELHEGGAEAEEAVADELRGLRLSVRDDRRREPVPLRLVGRQHLMGGDGVRRTGGPPPTPRKKI